MRDRRTSAPPRAIRILDFSGRIPKIGALPRSAIRRAEALGAGSRAPEGDPENTSLTRFRSRPPRPNRPPLRVAIRILIALLGLAPVGALVARAQEPAPDAAVPATEPPVVEVFEELPAPVEVEAEPDPDAPLDVESFEWTESPGALDPPVRPEELPAEDPAPDSTTVRVGDIRFEGLVSWQPEDLLARIDTRVGEPYNALVLREDIARLGAMLRRVQVRAVPIGEYDVRVVFDVEEFSRLRNLTIVGNDALSTERFEKIAGMTTGDVLDERSVKSLRQAIVEEYDKRGLSQARVDVNEIPVDPAETEPGPGGVPLRQSDLQVIVQEGEKIIVEDVKIEGNESFSNLRLKTLTRTRGSWLFIKNYYDDREFEDDLVAIRGFYNRKGYFDAVVERGEFQERTSEGKTRLTPVVRIAEGARYTVSDVRVRGTRLFSRDEVLDPFRRLIGKKFDGEEFARSMDLARSLYLDAGFLTTELRPEYDFDAETGGVAVTVDVREGERIYVGEIRVERPLYEDFDPGPIRRLYNRIAPPISDEAIKREILLKPGDVYSKRRERETERRLARLGVFSDTDRGPGVSIVNEPTTDRRVHDALIKLDEGPTGNVGVGIGFGDVSGGFGYFWVNERNLFGEAKDLRLQVSIGTGASNFLISYLDRHWRGTDDSLSVAAYYNRYRRTGYFEDTIGTRAEVQRPLYGDWTGGLRGRIEFVSLEERDGFEAEEDLNVSYPVLAARLGFEHDTRWPFDRPTEGRQLYAGVESGWADGFLVKVLGRGEFYKQLRARLTYRFTPVFEMIPYPGDSVGLTERAFLGGSEDLRGFRFRGAGRRDEREDEIGIGGSTKLLARNEFIFPIFDPVWGVYFVDAGLIGSSPVTYEIPRISTGLGARVQINRVTLALDFALPLLTGSGDQTQFVHFTFRSHL